MAQVTLTLTDTPTGGVAIHSEYKPAIGAPCTPAQSAALDIMRRTQREWGMVAAGMLPDGQRAIATGHHGPQGAAI